VSMSKFTAEEVEALQKGGNQVKASIELAACWLGPGNSLLVHVLTLNLNDTASERIVSEGFRYPANAAT
jgi:hypothetical protein